MSAESAIHSSGALKLGMEMNRAFSAWLPGNRIPGAMPQTGMK
jgi:hypothetical protein